jgi:hypothetical protein
MPLHNKNMTHNKNMMHYKNMTLLYRENAWRTFNTIFTARN